MFVMETITNQNQYKL